MATLNVKINPKSLECSICLGTVSDPRILPCGHTFCGPKSPDKCLQKLDPRNAAKIKCPNCQTDHHVRVADVPPDIKCREMLESLGSKKQGKRMCRKHKKKIVMRCVADGEEVCVSCATGDHRGHEMEEVHKQEHRRLSEFWSKENGKIEDKLLESKRREELFQREVEILEKQRLQEYFLGNQLENLKTRRGAITRKLAADDFNPNDDDITALTKYMDHLEATSEYQQDASEDVRERSQKLVELVDSRAPIYCQNIRTNPIPATTRATPIPRMIPGPSKRPTSVVQMHDEGITTLTEYMDQLKATSEYQQYASEDVRERSQKLIDLVDWRAPIYCQNIKTNPIPATTRATPIPRMIPGPSKRPTSVVQMPAAIGGGCTSRQGVGRRTLPEENVSCTTNILALGERGKHYILGLKDNKWEQWKESRTDFYWGFGAICLKEKVYIIGGIRKGVSSKVDIFHIQESKWTEGPELNTKRVNAAACFVESQRSIYICGGSKSGATKDNLSSVEKLELDENGSPVGAWREVTPMKEKRMGCAAVAVGTWLFVTGGADQNSKFLSSVEQLYIETEDWNYGPQMKECRAWHAVEHHDGTIFALGGFNPDNKLKSCEKLDLQSWTWTWSSIESMRHPHSHFGSVVANGKIYVVASWTSGDDGDSRSVEIYDPATNTWSMGPQLLEELLYTKCVCW